MRTEKLNELRPYLEEVAKAMDYKLEADDSTNESYIFVELVPKDRTMPRIEIDSLKDVLSFRTLLPLDRWGYPNKRHNGGTATTTITPSKNKPQTAANRLLRFLDEHKELHENNLLTVQATHNWYDNQMNHAAALNDMLDHLRPRPKLYGYMGKPNHQGVMDVSMDIPDTRFSAKITGSGVELSLGTLTPHQAAKVLHVLMQK